MSFTQPYGGRTEFSAQHTTIEVKPELAYSVSGVLAQDVAATADLEIGTILGKVTVSGEYAPYNDANSDGTETAVAILTRTITKEQLQEGTSVISVYVTGMFRTDKLVGLDANAITDLGAREFDNILVWL